MTDPRASEIQTGVFFVRCSRPKVGFDERVPLSGIVARDYCHNSRTNNRNKLLRAGDFDGSAIKAGDRGRAGGGVEVTAASNVRREPAGPAIR